MDVFGNPDRIEQRRVFDLIGAGVAMGEAAPVPVEGVPTAPVQVGAIAPPPVGVEAVAPAPVAVEVVAPVPVVPEQMPGDVDVFTQPDRIEQTAVNAAIGAGVAVPPAAEQRILPAVPAALPAGVAVAGAAERDVALAAPVANPVPPLVTWQAFMDAMREGVAELTKYAREFRGVVSSIGVPALAAMGPTVTQPDWDAMAPRLAAPVLTPPAMQAVAPTAQGGVMETRVVIDVNPSPLFDVKMRRTVHDVGREQLARGAMGAAGAGL